MKHLVFCLLPACLFLTEADVDERLDRDGDGVARSTDCDDADPAAYPGAPELCDLVDQDCDGEVDETSITGWLDGVATPLTQADTIVLTDFDEVVVCGGRWSTQLDVDVDGTGVLRSSPDFETPEWAAGQGSFISAQSASLSLGRFDLVGDRPEGAAPWIDIEDVELDWDELTLIGATEPLLVARNSSILARVLTIEDGLFPDEIAVPVVVTPLASIVLHNSSLRVQEGRWSGNTGRTAAGAHLLDGSALVCEACEAVDNSSPTDGGLFLVSGNSQVDFTGTASGQRADSGAVAYLEDTSKLSLSDCDLYDNIAEKSGGVVSSRASFTSVSVQRCVLENNRASDTGGVIAAGTVRVDESEFRGNYAGKVAGDISAVNLVAVDASFEQSASGDATGSVLMGQGALLNVRFVDGRAVGSGGCLGVYGEALLEETSFDGCQSGLLGGAVIAARLGEVGPRPRVHLSNVQFLNNTALSGGAIGLLNAEVNQESDADLVLFQNNVAVDSGGAIGAIEGVIGPEVSVRFDGSVLFKDNEAPRGSAIWLVAVAAMTHPVDPNCFFSDKGSQVPQIVTTAALAEGPVQNFALCDGSVCVGTLGCGQ